MEDFPAIDSLISARSYDVLSDCMAAIDGIQGQVAVIDARTSDVLAWGALEIADGDIVNAPMSDKVNKLIEWLKTKKMDWKNGR